MGMLTDGAVVLFSYAVGCMCAGYYLTHFRTGQDLRSMGSGAVGARNAGRILGAWGFALTFLVDFAKGAAAVWLAYRVGREPPVVMMCVIAVVAGHIWPLQLKFRGGKGIATGIGAVVMFDGPWGAFLPAVLTVLILVAHRRNIRAMLSPAPHAVSR